MKHWLLNTLPLNLSPDDGGGDGGGGDNGGKDGGSDGGGKGDDGGGGKTPAELAKESYLAREGKRLSNETKLETLTETVSGLQKGLDILLNAHTEKAATAAQQKESEKKNGESAELAEILSVVRKQQETLNSFKSEISGFKTAMSESQKKSSRLDTYRAMGVNSEGIRNIQCGVVTITDEVYANPDLLIATLTSVGALTDGDGSNGKKTFPHKDQEDVTNRKGVKAGEEGDNRNKTQEEILAKVEKDLAAGFEVKTDETGNIIPQTKDDIANQFARARKIETLTGSTVHNKP